MAPRRVRRSPWPPRRPSPSPFPGLNALPMIYPRNSGGGSLCARRRVPLGEEGGGPPPLPNFAGNHPPRSTGAATWPAVVGLYDHLLALTRSPVVMLNRAVAL